MSKLAANVTPKFQVGDMVAIQGLRHWFWRRLLAPIAGLFSRRLARRLCWRWTYARVTHATGPCLTVEWKQ